MFMTHICYISVKISLTYPHEFFLLDVLVNMTRREGGADIGFLLHSLQLQPKCRTVKIVEKCKAGSIKLESP